MSLIDKIRKTGRKLALAGVLGSLGFSGCEIHDGAIYLPGEYEYWKKQRAIAYQQNQQNSQPSNASSNNELALFGLGLMGTGVGRNNPGAAAVGQSMVGYAGQKANKSEVNVNIDDSGGNYQDYNNVQENQIDKIATRNTTDSGESELSFQTSVWGNKGKYLFFEAYNKEGKLLCRTNGTKISDNANRFDGRITFNQNELNSLGIKGECEIRWLIGSKSALDSGDVALLSDRYTIFVP